MASVENTGTIQQDMASRVKKGTQALENGDLMAALDTFEEVVCAFPDRPEGHNNLGALYNALGENEKAETCFDRVLEILPGNPDILYNRAVVRSRLEKFDGAREDFRAVLEARPQDHDTLNNLGVMDFMQGRLDTAAEYFQRSLEIHPDGNTARLNLIDVVHANGNTAEAVRLCEEHLAGTNDLEIRRKLFELLSSGCREALDRASHAAETLLAVEDKPETRQELVRLGRARTVLSPQVGQIS